MNDADSIKELLLYIEDIQKSVIELSHSSMLNISAFIEKNSLEADEEVALSLQYQDIISQQLNSVIETIESVKNRLDNNEELNMSSLLDEAREKKERFMGKTAHESVDEIEFF